MRNDLMKKTEADMHEADDHETASYESDSHESDSHESDSHESDSHELDELGTLFAAARELTPADLGAADRFLAANAGMLGRAGRRRRVLRLWAGAVLGAAAALGGLTLLGPSGPPPTPADLPASAAYSVYRSAIGEGW